MDGDGRPVSQDYSDLALRSRPNWTAVGFLGLLAGLHVSVAVPAILAGHWEGYLSGVFATLFVAAATLVFHIRTDVTVLGGARRRVHVHTRLGPVRLGRREIPFARVHAVRVTLGPRASRDDSSVELLCAGHDGDVLCPPTAVPRQQGLLLAMMIGVPLVKAWDDPVSFAGPGSTHTPGQSGARNERSAAPDPGERIH
jgi:hypothetical protein